MAPLPFRLANLALLVMFPIAWAAPLLHAGLLPWFGGTEISILSGMVTLWEEAPLLALLVGLFAVIAPMAKTLALTAGHWNLLPPRAAPWVALASKLAMADVFLVALYIVAAKGVGVGRVSTAWGLWLFTACVLLSLALSLIETRRHAGTGRP